VPLANAVVTDDKLGPAAGAVSGDANNNGLLDATETWIYVITAVAQPGQVSSSARHDGTMAFRSRRSRGPQGPVRPASPNMPRR
jgi:hypothetical protein